MQIIIRYFLLGRILVVEKSGPTLIIKKCSNFSLIFSFVSPVSLSEVIILLEVSNKQIIRFDRKQNIKIQKHNKLIEAESLLQSDTSC